MPSEVLVNEIFSTIEGEGLHAGLPCVIVRLAGCNLRCRWCDTKYAYDDGRPMAVGTVVDKVRLLDLPLALVTGGEPLLQAGCPELLSALCAAGLEVLLETNGSLDISGLDGRVVRCVDVKCPGSGQGQSFLWSNLDCLRACDEVKFILADRGDYDFARDVLREHRLSARCAVIMTPAAGLLDAATLAEWIVQDRLPVRLGLQVHKVIWPGAQRGK